MKKALLYLSPLLMIFTLAFSVTTASAQIPGLIKAEVDRVKIHSGETLTLTVTINMSGGNAADPSLPPLDGFNIVSTSSGTQFSMVNGATSMEAVYQYRLQPTRSGDLVIEPITVVSNGYIYGTDPIAITVSQGGGPGTQPPSNPPLPGFPNMPGFPSIPGFPSFPSLPGFPMDLLSPQDQLDQLPQLDPNITPDNLAGQDFFVEAQVDNLNPYLGQQVNYTFRFYQAENLYGQPQYEGPAFTNFWRHPELQENEYTTRAAGRGYLVTELSSSLFPTFPGETTIEPSSITIPDDIFTSGGILRTQPISINVRALPGDAPPGFDGAVGKFDIQSEIDTRFTRVNEAVTLKIILRGRGNLETITDLDWVDSPEWRAFDSTSTSETQIVDGVVSGIKTFEQVLVPTTSGQFTLPAVHFNYFDPGSNNYQTISTQPVMVNVAPDINPVVSGVPDNTQFILDTPVQSSIRPLKPAAAITSESSMTPLTQNPFYWALWGLPVLLLVGQYGWQRRVERHHRQPEIRRSRMAARKAKKALKALKKSNDPNSECGPILTKYLAEKLNQSILGYTENNLTNLLVQQGIDPMLIERIGACLMLSEMGRYAPLGEIGHPGDLVSETSQIITDLENNIHVRAVSTE